jgi:hypothetical protein
MPRATQVLIEDKANGPAVIEQLRCDPDFGLAVIEYDPKGSKTQRFVAACADAEGGLVWMPEDAPWIGQLRKVLCDYAGEGSVAKDDDCDAWSQFVNWSRQYQYGLLDYLDAQAKQAEAPVYRCEMVDEFNVTHFLEWDEAKKVWVDPKNASAICTAKSTPPPSGRVGFGRTKPSRNLGVLRIDFEARKSLTSKAP